MTSYLKKSDTGILYDVDKKTPLQKFNILKSTYFWGRFFLIRRMYSLFRRLSQIIGLERVGQIFIKDYGHRDYKEIAKSKISSTSSELSVEDHVSRLRKESFSSGIQLSADCKQALLDIARSYPLVSHSGDSTPFYYTDIENTPSLTDNIAIASVVNSSDMPAIGQIASDSLITSVVSQYLGYKPTKVTTWLFWSFANQIPESERQSKHSQTIQFHYDVHGLNFIYVNFYLLDTDLQSGAHVLIKGSHHNKKLSLLFNSVRLSDDAAIDIYGKDRIVTVEGESGAGFFEDTSCYHKALPPKKHNRLLLQLRYE